MARGWFCGGLNERLTQRERRKKQCRVKSLLYPATPSVWWLQLLVTRLSIAAPRLYLITVSYVLNAPIPSPSLQSYAMIVRKEKINSLQLNLQKKKKKKDSFLCTRIDNNSKQSRPASKLGPSLPWREGWRSERERWSSLPTARQLHHFSSSPPPSQSHLHTSFDANICKVYSSTSLGFICTSDRAAREFWMCDKINK